MTIYGVLVRWPWQGQAAWTYGRSLQSYTLLQKGLESWQSHGHSKVGKTKLFGTPSSDKNITYNTLCTVDWSLVAKISLMHKIQLTVEVHAFGKILFTPRFSFAHFYRLEPSSLGANVISLLTTRTSLLFVQYPTILPCILPSLLLLRPATGLPGKIN